MGLREVSALSNMGSSSSVAATRAKQLEGLAKDQDKVESYVICVAIALLKLAACSKHCACLENSQGASLKTLPLIRRQRRH